MQDRRATDSLISISYPEITEWCDRLGCTEVQLAEAIAAVGYSAIQVEAYLTRQSAPQSPSFPASRESAPP